MVEQTRLAVVPEDLRYLKRFYDDLATVQHFAGSTFGPRPMTRPMRRRASWLG